MQHRKQSAHHGRLGAVLVPRRLSVVHPGGRAPGTPPGSPPAGGPHKPYVPQHGRKLHAHVCQHLQRCPAQHVLACKRARRLPATLHATIIALLSVAGLEVPFISFICCVSHYTGHA